MYMLLEFDDGSTGPVAEAWVDGASAWWPPYATKQDLIKSLKTRETPQPDRGWTRHSICRVLYNSGNLKIQKETCRLSKNKFSHQTHDNKSIKHYRY